ncbi:MAG TPA: hypothetical protein VM121_07425 [Acidimicrobiales bacterium]|nr:hypothetical protein [Acidimicrobiales bacterium]
MVTDRASAIPVLAGALTVGAGLVHASAAGTHGDNSTMVALMAVTAVVQVAIGMVGATRPSRPALAVLVGVNLIASAAWILSRTSGLPVIDALAQPEAVGLQDLTAMVLESTGVVVGAIAFAAGSSRKPIGFSPLWTLALVPALIGMTAPHTHAEGHEHGAGGSGHVAAHEHVAADLAGDPIFAGANTDHASEKELERAKALIESTRAAARPFTDKAALTAAGYRSIGDGFPFTTHEHFINADYLNDGREVDPNHVESFVLEGTGPGAPVVSAMYILEKGETMDDVPDIGGDVTTWHDHQDLCWDESGVRLAGVLMNGRCFPSGTLRPTPPMLHVWLADNKCGPFAGIEGHPAAACAAGHTH